MECVEVHKRHLIQIPVTAEERQEFDEFFRAHRNLKKLSTMKAWVFSGMRRDLARLDQDGADHA